MIVLHANVSVEREQAIAAYGAVIVRIAGSYDESVAEAARLAAVNGWHVVSDTSYEGYEDIPRDVMQGYATIAAEIVEQPGGRGYTHVFLQGGVGGLAAGLISYLWSFMARIVRASSSSSRNKPTACIRAHWRDGPRATGSVDSVMAGLACGETSPLAWKFLQPGVDDFMTIHDEDAVDAMRILAAGSDTDVPIVAGESGVAGLAGLIVLLRDAQVAGKVGLDGASRILLINTEGATAPATYRELVGESAESVLERQAAWRDRATA